MLKIENLHKAFDTTDVLRGVDLQLSEGTILGILGPNGMGKTTLLKCVVGILEPDRGKITWEGRNLLTSVVAKHCVGYVGEQRNYYPRFRVEDLVRFYRMSYPNWDHEQYRRLQGIFDLPSEQRIANLSRGMKAQLAFLLNLSIMPDLLILDEPTSGLDPAVRKEVLRVMVDQTAACGTTMLVSSHNAGELERICDAVAFIRDGEIALQGPLEELRRRFAAVHVIFDGEMPAEIAGCCDLLYVERLGRMYALVGRRPLLSRLQAVDTVYLEPVDTSLEDIYIYYMEGPNHE